MAQQVANSMDGLQKILETLVPPGSIEVEDINGKKHTLPSAVPARRQIALLRIVQEMQAVAVSDAEVAALGKLLISGGGERGVPAALGALIVELADNEKFLALLGKAFETAHPSACREGNPLDLFGVEELVAGLVPLFVRILKRAGSALGALAAVTPELTEAAEN